MIPLPFRIAVFPVTPYRQNCSLLWCADSRAAAVIDPGGGIDRILARAAAEGATIEKIFLTHGHLDHASGAARLSRETGAPVEGPHADDSFLLSSLTDNRSIPGFEGAENVAPARFLKDGDTVSFGAVAFEVLHCPGHTPGHVVYFHREGRIAFSGDVLFQGSIGRTDFPGSSHPQLVESIVTKLWPLGDDVRFLPGHGPMSSFGAERRNNPFVGDFGPGD